MNIPRRTTEHVTYSNHDIGLAAVIWNTDSETHPFRVIFRDTQAGETLAIREYSTLARAESEARSFVA